MKSEIKSLTIAVNGKLAGYLQQLKEMNEFIEKLEFDVKDSDEVLREMIWDVGAHIYDTATSISEIIGRETLSIEYFGNSCFTLKNKQSDENKN